MSTGTAKSAESSTKDEFLKSGNIEVATKWCNSCREILGIPFLGKSGAMDTAIQKSQSGLATLTKMAKRDPSIGGNLQSLTLEYQEMAWELNLLRLEHQGLEKQKSDSGFFSSKRSRAKESIDRVVAEIEELAIQLNSIASKIEKQAEKAGRERQEKLEAIGKSADGSAIKDAKKKFLAEVAVLEKAIKEIGKKYDATLVNKYVELLAGHTSVDWAKVSDVATANARLIEVQKTVQDLKLDIAAYGTAFEEYNKVREEFVQHIYKAELVLTEVALKPFMTMYSEGIAARQQKNWVEASKHINQVNLQLLKSKIEQDVPLTRDWQKIKATKLGEAKILINLLQGAEFKLLGTSIYADAIAEIETTGDLSEAELKLVDVLVQISSLKRSSEVVFDCIAEVNTKAEDLEGQLANLTGDAAPFATEYAGEILALRTEMKSILISLPTAKGTYLSEDEVEAFRTEVVARLERIEHKIGALGDVESLKSLKEAVAARMDLSPSVSAVEQQLKLVESEKINYLGLRVDPPADALLSQDWDRVIKEAADWVSNANKRRVLDDRATYDTEVDLGRNHVLALEGVFSDLTNRRDAARDGLTKAKEDLQSELKNLEKALSTANAKTIRKATWVSAVTVEIEEMKAVLKSNNLNELKECLERSRVLTKQSLNVAEEGTRLLNFNQKRLEQYDQLKAVLVELIKELKDKDLASTMKRQVSIYGGTSGLTASLLDELRTDGPGCLDTDVDYNKWKSRIDTHALKVKQLILDPFAELKVTRDACRDLCKEIRDRIFSELCPLVQKVAAVRVDGEYLEFSGRLLEIEGQLGNADSNARFTQLRTQLTQLNEEVDWAIQDLSGAQANSNAKVFVDEQRRGEDLNRKVLSEIGKFQGQYDLAREDYKRYKDIASKANGLDQKEFKRLVDASKKASEAYRKQNYQDAAKQMQFVSKMMNELAQNPGGSMVHAGGPQNLLAIDSRWKNSLKIMSDSLDCLANAVKVSCESAAGDVPRANVPVVVDLLKTRALDKVKSKFESDAFLRDLTVLMSPAPSDKALVSKDIEKKRKYRESLLAKLRSYQSLIHSDPMMIRLFFQANPWTNKKGNVKVLELIRTINDLNLNVERSVD